LISCTVILGGLIPQVNRANKPDIFIIDVNNLFTKSRYCFNNIENMKELRGILKCLVIFGGQKGKSLRPKRINTGIKMMT
jgi:hypothetical protein